MAKEVITAEQDKRRWESKHPGKIWPGYIHKEPPKKVKESKKPKVESTPQDRRRRAKRAKRRWEKNHPGEAWPGYSQSQESRDHVSQSKKGCGLGKASPMKGRVSPMRGKHHSDDSRAQQSLAMTGKPSAFKGKHHTDSSKLLLSLAHTGKIRQPLSLEQKQKLSMIKQGITNPEDWVGFSKPKRRYCWKWRNPKLKIRKRVRAWWGNRCAGCGATRADEYHRFLHVDHVGNDKQACCKDNPEGWLFVPLCTKCHGLSGGKYQAAADKKYTELIMTKYHGKCYYTPEEYEALVESGVLKTEDYGRRDGR